MATLDEVRTEAAKLNDHIHSFLKMSGYEKWGGIEVSDKKQDADSIFIGNTLAVYAEKLDYLTGYIDRIQNAIADHGKLVKNGNGRYELNGHEFTCGSSIEFLCNDGEYDIPYWRYSTIEARNGEYYLTADPETPLDGLEVRTREY